MAGSASRSADGALPAALAIALAALLFISAAAAQSLYKYRGPDGTWIYSDRAPAEDAAVEVRELPGRRVAPGVTVAHHFLDGQVRLAARNDYFVPVELVLGIEELLHTERPDPLQSLRWVLAAQSDTELMSLRVLDSGAPKVTYRYTWIPGDPTKEHRPERAYRVPFAVASTFTVSQAFPDAITHSGPDSRYAVDIVMPVGTGVYAARGGTVFEVASTNFRGGLDAERDAPAANLVRILHDDSTWGEYAHLNWNSIRVQPGDRVTRGEYIANSGNTGFSSGPHLHFAVVRNAGMRVESVPFVFEGPNGNDVAPETGAPLTAY